MNKIDAAIEAVREAENTNKGKTYRLSIGAIWGLDSRTDEKIIELGVACGRHVETILEALQAMKDRQDDKGVMDALEVLDFLSSKVNGYKNAKDIIYAALLAKQETDEYIQSIRDILEDVEDLRPQKEGTFGFRDTLKGKILYLKEQAKQPDLNKLTVHIILDTLASAARGRPLDPEECQTIEEIVKDYDHKDFTKEDIQALYDCGHKQPDIERLKRVEEALIYANENLSEIDGKDELTEQALTEIRVVIKEES